MAGGGTSTTMVLGRTSMVDRRSLRGVVAAGMDDVGETAMDRDMVTKMDGVGAMDGQVGWGLAMDPRLGAATASCSFRLGGGAQYAWGVGSRMNTMDLICTPIFMWHQICSQRKA
jgi:hypothetical protein